MGIAPKEEKLTCSTKCRIKENYQDLIRWIMEDGMNAANNGIPGKNLTKYSHFFPFVGLFFYLLVGFLFFMVALLLLPICLHLEPSNFCSKS